MADKPRIYITRRQLPAIEERLRAETDAAFNEDDHAMSADEIVAAAEGREALFVCVTEAMTAEVIARLPERVQAILTLSVGTDHIDLEAAKARGIAVLATPDAVTNPTVEIGMLLLLGAARQAAQGGHALRAGAWKRWGPTDFIGREITGSPLGIFGMGRIGRLLAQRARAFDMQIRYHNRVRLPFDQEGGASYYTTPEGLLAASPFLVIAAPSTPETRGFLDAGRIAALPDGAIVVNIARGDLVDDDALIDALKSGKVAAAGLDVFNGEPAGIHPGYFELTNVFMTPHIGSAGDRARVEMGMMLIDGLARLRAGEPVANRVV